MQKYWFRPRKLGIGFTPVTWEGWLTVLVMLIVIGISAYKNNLFDERIFTTKDGLKFLVEFFLIVLVFFLFSVPKTNGEIKWRWQKK